MATPTIGNVAELAKKAAARAAARKNPVQTTKKTSKTATKKTTHKKSAATREGHSKRSPFPTEKVQKLWKEGKSITEIAKAVGRFREDQKDPTASFRGSINLMRQKGQLDLAYRSSLGGTEADKKPAKKSAKKK